MTNDMRQFLFHLGLLTGCRHMKYASGPRMAAVATRYFRSLRGLKLRGYIHVVTERGQPTRYALTYDGFNAMQGLSMRIDWCPTWLGKLEWSMEA